MKKVFNIDGDNFWFYDELQRKLIPDCNFFWTELECF
jgi:hypothetical protein